MVPLLLSLDLLGSVGVCVEGVEAGAYVESCIREYISLCENMGDSEADSRSCLHSRT